MDSEKKPGSFSRSVGLSDRWILVGRKGTGSSPPTTVLPFRKRRTNNNFGSNFDLLASAYEVQILTESTTTEITARLYFTLLHDSLSHRRGLVFRPNEPPLHSRLTIPNKRPPPPQQQHNTRYQHDRKKERHRRLRRHQTQVRRRQGHGRESQGGHDGNLVGSARGRKR